MTPPPAAVTRVGPAVLQLVAAGWALSCLDASGKWAMEAGASLLLLCWVRYVMHLLVSVAVVWRVEGLQRLRSVNPAPQWLRAGFMLASTLSFYATLRLLPQAESTAIVFLAPLLVLLLAPLLLRERPQLRRWLAAAGGFAGVLVIIRPGAGLHGTGTALGLLTAFLFAGQFIANRLVARDHPLTTLVWGGAIGSLVFTLALPWYWEPALAQWQQMGPWPRVVLLSTGLWGALGHLLQISAYRNAPASLLAPFTYLQIVAATTLGWLVWRQFPDALTWLGIGLVIASGMGIMLRELRGVR